MKIKKGDTVKILYGKDSGKRGQVVAIDSKNKTVVVEGVNVYKKHLKGDGRTRTSEIVNIEKSLPVSKVMLVCPVCEKPTRVAAKKDGKNVVRVCKKCGKDMVEVKKEEKKVEKKVEKKEEKKSEKKETKSKKETK